MTLRELIDKAQSGNEEAQVRFVDRFKKFIWKRAHRYFWVESEDLQQDLIVWMLKTLKTCRINAYHDEQIIKYFLTSIARESRRLAWQYYRLQKYGVLNLDDHKEGIAYEDGFSKIEENLFVDHVLSLLTRQQREVIKGIILGNFTDRTMAARMNVSHQAVNRIKQRAIKRLREYLQSDNLGYGPNGYRKVCNPIQVKQKQYCLG